MEESTLQHLIYRHSVDTTSLDDSSAILAVSEAVDADAAIRLMNTIPLEPLPLEGIEQTRAVAFIRVEDAGKVSYILARSQFQKSDQQFPAKQFIFIPDDEALPLLDYEVLFNLLKQPLDLQSTEDSLLEPLHIPHISSNDTADARVAILKSLLDDVLHDDFRLFAGILALALDGNLVIRNFPMDSLARINLVRGLRFLLPAVVRQHVTFTTFAQKNSEHQARVRFDEVYEDESVVILDWQAPQIEESYYEQDYIRLLLSIWTGDIIRLGDTIKRFNAIAARTAIESANPGELLSAIAKRHMLDVSALSGETLSSEDIIAVLKSDVPLSKDLQTAYVILLLENTFESRDPEMAVLAGQTMDRIEGLNKDLEPFLESSIEVQPDAVYAFVRTYLNSFDSDHIPDQEWLSRLHDAADASVKVAIASEDGATIRGWIALISREPLRYELSDILRDTMRATLDFVNNNPELARELLTVAVKRQPEMIDDLLQDADLLEALPEYNRQALIDLSPEAIETTGNESRELFLLALYRGISQGEAVLTSSCARTLWQIHTGQQTNTLPVQFRPLSLIQSIIENPAIFVNGAYKTLLSRIFASPDYDSLFFNVAGSLREHEQFASTMAAIFGQSDRDNNTLVEIIAFMLTEEYLSGQNAVDILSGILTNRDWGADNLALAEQLSRVMTRFPDTTATDAVLRKLLALSAQQENEQMLKASLRRLLDSITNLATESQIVERISAIRKDSGWSHNGRSTLLKWWRTYVQNPGAGHLQKIEKALEGNRNLEDLRAIIQTTLAMRRIIGNRTLEEFSEAVATTYALLQALSEGFDPADKLVDSATIRSEIEARAEELPERLRPVLSTNLKELAHLVTTLSENRSKPSLIRSDDAVERQLVKGEQEPQSAIDVMRWLSGYLDGVQKSGDSE